MQSIRLLNKFDQRGTHKVKLVLADLEQDAKQYIHFSEIARASFKEDCCLLAYISLSEQLQHVLNQKEY
jgi:hypothetical protein